jgi:hypothetical protein
MMISLLVTCSLLSAPLEIDPDQSSIDGEFQQSTFMPGTLIGNWDPKTNPEGTSTLPGFWGGSGNNLIGVELTPSLGGPFDSPCMGGLSIELDLQNGLVSIENLLLTTFDNGPAAFPVTLGMLYETFRTVQPDSLFPGGIPIDIPLGEGSLTAMQYEQVLAVTTELAPISTNLWSYYVDIPVTVTIEAIVFETKTGPLVSPGVLQLSGTIELSNNQYQFMGTTSFKSNEVIENPPIAFENIPFEAPTILPSGQIAHLLLSANSENATLSTAANLHFTAIGSDLLPGDVDGDGTVGVTDVLAIIGAWGPCSECSEDLNNDGSVNVTDLLDVIAHWSGS